MKVTVKDCLSLEAFKDARLVVGAKQAENRVKAVSVLETTNIEEVKSRFAHEGELVLSGYFIKNADEKSQLEIVKTLAEAGTAGLVLFYVEAPEVELKRDVLSVAEKVGLPIIVMAPRKDLKYSDVINQVMENVLYGDNQLLMLNINVR